MRRTTSMSGIIVEGPPRATSMEPQTPMIISEEPVVVGSGVMSGYEYDQRLTAMVLSPRYDRISRDHHRRRGFGGGGANQAVETAEFLRTCSLCNRRLSSRRDIYIYRGDTAFCSIECREQKIKQDERQEKLSSVASNSEEYHHHHHHPNTYSPSAVNAISDASSNTETIAAA